MATAERTLAPIVRVHPPGFARGYSSRWVVVVVVAVVMVMVFVVASGGLAVLPGFPVHAQHGHLPGHRGAGEAGRGEFRPGSPVRVVCPCACLCGRARVCVRLRTGGLVMLLVCRTVSPRYAALLPMVAAATQGFVDELEQEMEEEKAEEKVQSAAAKTTSRL